MIKTRRKRISLAAVLPVRDCFESRGEYAKLISPPAVDCSVVVTRTGLLACGRAGSRL